jgi:hypothetical protein
VSGEIDHLEQDELTRLQNLLRPGIKVVHSRRGQGRVVGWLPDGERVEVKFFDRPGQAERLLPWALEAVEP